jgi:hypothetical protein
MFKAFDVYALIFSSVLSQRRVREYKVTSFLKKKEKKKTSKNIRRGIINA